ncbi:phospholipase A2 inhibitor and Ly6/PLAUR domain-containing protein-like [Eretmochelys imbricata]
MRGREVEEEGTQNPWHARRTGDPAQTVTCQACSGSADSCQPPSGTCPADTAKGGCFTVAEDLKLVGETKSTSVSKGCVRDFTAFIKGPVTVTLGNGKYVRVNIAQCSTDKCNSAVLAVPKENTTKNGLQCPTCFALSTNPCDSQDAPCTGDENYCIDFAGYLVKGSPLEISTFVAKGCASESVKGIKSGDSLVSAVYGFAFTEATSKPATPSGASPALGKFSFALYLPGLTGLLLVKLLS